VDALDRLSPSLSQLAPAERRVAAVMAEHPDRIIRGTLASVAREAGVSEPTVLRFCRTIGVGSFKDLKIELAQSLAAGNGALTGAVIPRQIHPDDSVQSAMDKVFALAIDALARTQQALSKPTVERAAMAIVKARRVVIFGLGASAIVAAEAQHKLFRLGIAVAAYSDPHLQAMSAATLGPDDVVLAISQTGTARDVIETTGVAQQGGVTVIAVTRTGAPLAAIAHILLPVDIIEPEQIWTPMISRLAHLTTIDALVVGVALLAPPSSQEGLRRMQHALAARRVTA
jgi:RpiR family transcriptional regulator, carbohydrate utilization regulator